MIEAKNDDIALHVISAEAVSDFSEKFTTISKQESFECPSWYEPDLSKKYDGVQLSPIVCHI